MMRQPWLQTVLKHGYVIVSVDVRGGGASYGTYQGTFSPEETRDAYDITEWLAVQPWSNGNIGMYGRSYLGITQYMAASTAPPHLKVIFPEMAMFDLYSLAYPGGVFHDDFVRQWGDMVKVLDTYGAAVDEDTDRAMLREAGKQHATNRDVFELALPLHYRDSVSKATGTLFFSVNNPASYVREIKSSGIVVYHWVGWYDTYPLDALLWYSNLTNPQKIVIGPWTHGGSGFLGLAEEHLRWYDYWLKGIDNGIMQEAPIYYYTMGAEAKRGWHSAWQWPLPNEKPTNYYFNGENSGSVKSINDGTLSQTLPTTTVGIDDYGVDYSTTTGTATRWTEGSGGKLAAYPDMTSNDEKGLTYTSSPFTSEVEVTGHPIVHLWVTSTARDGDFFVYLEDVNQKGYSQYITEGTLRASHRAVSTAPYDNLGLPYHRSYAEDIADLPDQPTELIFDLLPTSYVFDVGHRMRVTITCADKDNALTPELNPPPTIHLYREANHTSYIVLPIIPNPGR
jgi:putative CocE/NonD family hydrolase